jgi:hypothetical protein
VPLDMKYCARGCGKSSFQQRVLCRAVSSSAATVELGDGVATVELLPLAGSVTQWDWDDGPISSDRSQYAGEKVCCHRCAVQASRLTLPLSRQHLAENSSKSTIYFLIQWTH